MSGFDVVVVGSLNLDLVAHCERLPGPGETVGGTTFAEYAGGKGLNQAVAAARSGARVALIGAIGTDAAGERLRAIVRAEGIDDSRVVSSPDQPTGRAMINVDGAGENSIVVIPGANARVEIPDIPDAAVILAQLEIDCAAVETAFSNARSRGMLTVLNPAPVVDVPADLLRLCDVVVPNEHEIELLGGSSAVLATGVHDLVITRGSAGADHHGADGSVTHVDAFAVEAVDTTGAGDAFCGALSARLAIGASMADALRWATAAGALSTMQVGAVPSQPHHDDIVEMLQR